MKLNATMVANEFIDKYMAGANGEYVKVYLYILRHQGMVRDAGQIADDLNHTESDVKRAIGYWVRQGVLDEGQDLGNGAKPRAEAGKAGGDNGLKGAAMSGNGDNGFGKAPVLQASADSRDKAALPAAGKAVKESAASAEREQAALPRKTYTPEQVSRLADQEDFTQLLYISQKYMDKIFTPRECEVFAYLYDALHMPAELLEYLVEYCVQNGHVSIRYLESVAINWHEKGFRTVDEAKAYTAAFSKEGFAVMRAFGISDRRPGDSEQEMIRKWFREFGFTRDIVLEACSRTLKAIHKPSFSYADKILADWKKGGVRVMADIERMDQQRERDGKKGNKAETAAKPAKNRFHNFEQRDTNYDAMVLERLKERLGEP